MINDKVDFNNSTITELFVLHALLKTVIPRRKCYTYITENIKLLIKLKDKAYKRYVLNRTVAHLEYYKQLKNYLSTAIKSERSV